MKRGAFTWANGVCSVSGICIWYLIATGEGSVGIQEIVIE